MKIAMIGHKRIPSREGGVEIVIEELAKRYVEAGHEVHVYNRRGGHVSGDRFSTVNKQKTYKGIRIITIPTLKAKSLNALIYSFLASLRALVGKYDVIHYHAEGPAVMLLIPHIFGIKTVATVHGLDWQRSKWGGFASKYLLLGERILAKYADEVIVLSHGVKNYFYETYKRRVTYIPNGIDRPTSLDADIIKSSFKLNPNKYILFLGRIVPEKGIHYLIEAYKDSNIGMPLVIAGGSSHTNDYMNTLKASVDKDDKIIFTDFVMGKTLAELYSNAYLYVLPSDVEGMPLSLLEAMSYGNCCLVSDIPENKDVVKSFGVTFKKGDVNDLKQNLEFLCTNKKIVDNYKGKGASYICSSFSWDTIVKQTLDLYNGGAAVNKYENINAK